VNCRNLTVGSGGNRILFALDAPAGRGFDLVHLASGALQLGINQWPDGTPALSSGGRITADANAGDANWVFFAASYDSTLTSGQVKFYFGNANTPATLDVARDYNRGEIVASGAVTLGNFGTVVGARTATGPTSSGSRVLRGLLDEIKVFPEALSADQVLVVQTNGTVTATPPTFLLEPVDQKVFLGNDATFTAFAAGTPVISYQWQRDNVDIVGATSNSYTVVGATLADSGAQFRVVATSPYGSVTSSNATLYVNTDVDPPTVLAVTTHRNLNRLTVTFSEPVEEQSGTDYFNYIFSGDNIIATLSAVLQPDLTNVLLTTDPMLPGGSYTLTISAVKDRAMPIPNEMIATNWSFTAYTPPPRTVPLVETRFEEGFGSTVTNTGVVGGTGTIDFGVASSVPGLPAFAGNVPTGPYAPSGNNYALYTGTGAGHAQYAGKAVDFPNEVRTNTVGLTEFTVTGWINVTDGTIGSGGNRIVTTWPQNVDGVNENRLTGVDVVVAANGTLRLGVNQAPDYPTPPGNIGPTSSTGKVGISPTGDPANWVFFAVTYDASLASENAAFYFGDVNTPAAKDTGATLTTYPRGAIADCTAPVTLTLGNFMASAPLASTRDSTSNNRAFRGYMDEIRFFQYALTPEEIQQIQTLGGPVVQIPVGISLQPVSQLAFEGQSATFFASVTGSPPITVQWQRNGQDIAEATNLTLTLPQVSLADDGATFRLVASNALAVAVSDDATLQVLPEDGRKVRFTFEEGTGTTTTNLGNLLGYGAFAQQNTLPAFSSNVPLGPFAPTINAASVDFGTISAGEGGRAIDLTGALLPSLGAMDGFTASGWLNARDLTIGSGGNRIVFALESPDGRGFDLVQLADGSMRLGVNQWPDGAGGGGPISSTGKITADPSAGANNWVFFAVTYDSSLPSGQVNYYFGNPLSAAARDVTADYDRGPLLATGTATVGNFGVVVGARTDLNNSRVFRGLMDDINIFNRPLTLAQIQMVQQGLPVQPTLPPLAIGRDDTTVVITWTADEALQLESREAVETGDWTNVTETPDVNGTTFTVRVPIGAGNRFFRLRSQ
jgi:hypothetical protein